MQQGLFKKCAFHLAKRELDVPRIFFDDVRPAPIYASNALLGLTGDRGPTGSQRFSLLPKVRVLFNGECQGILQLALFRRAAVDVLNTP